MNQGTLDLDHDGKGTGESRCDAFTALLCGRPGCNLPVPPQKRGGDLRRHCSRDCQRRAWEEGHPRVGTGRDALARLPALRREQKARDKGMGLAAEKNAEYLAQAREVARDLGEFWAKVGKGISINHVRECCEDQSWEIVWGNWAGSIFKGKQWERVGYTQARHEDSHARVVGVWRLKEE